MLACIAGLACGRLAWGDEIPALDEQLAALAQQAPLSLQFTGSTADECRRWQAEFGAKLRALLGPHSPPAQWDSVLERTVELADHVRQERLLVAEGLASVPYHLLLPRAAGQAASGSGAGRRPAILALHGHGVYGHDSVAGVAETTQARQAIEAANYDYGRQFARRGYVVAAPCLLPFGRRRHPDPARRQGDACAATYVRLQLLGRLLMAENLRDCLWTFAELARRPEVDPARIGVVGLSYGGRMTMLTAAVEPRLRVAVASGALNCMQERIQTAYSGGCQVIPGLLEYGDVPEIASLIAPRPCLWETGSRDALIKPQWAEQALERMGRAYRALGADDRLMVDRFEGGHRWHGVAACELLDEVLAP